MLSEKGVAIIGVLLIVIGVFLPISSLDSFVDRNNENDVAADGNGVYVLIIAGVALLLILMDRLEYLWTTTLLLFWPLLSEFAYLRMLQQSDLGLSLGSGWIAIAGGLIFMATSQWLGVLRKRLNRQQHSSNSVPNSPEDSKEEELV